MFANKAVYSTGFRFPLAVTGACQVFAAIAAAVLIGTGGMQYRPCASWTSYFRAVLPTALATAATLYSGNVAVMLLPVTYVQIIKGFTPSVALVLSAAMGTEKPTFSLVATVLAISAGSAVSCIHQQAQPAASSGGLTVQVRRCASAALTCSQYQLVNEPDASYMKACLESCKLSTCSRAWHWCTLSIRMQLLACIFEAVRAIGIKQMQRARPQGFNLAETLLMLAQPTAACLLAMSAVIEGREMLQAGPALWRHGRVLVATLAVSSILTDLTCYLALRVRLHQAETGVCAALPL